MQTETTLVKESKRGEYHFQHAWKVSAPLEIVWDIISSPGNWSSILYGSASDISINNIQDVAKGNRYCFTIKGRLPYSLSFQATMLEIQPEASLDMKFDGDLTGSGNLKITEDNNSTHIVFDMNVSPEKLWMKLISPIARGLFIHNHNFVVKKSYDALKNKIVMEM